MINEWETSQFLTPFVLKFRELHTNSFQVSWNAHSVNVQVDWNTFLQIIQVLGLLITSHSITNYSKNEVLILIRTKICSNTLQSDYWIPGMRSGWAFKFRKATKWLKIVTKSCRKTRKTFKLECFHIGWVVLKYFSSIKTATVQIKSSGSFWIF